MVVASYSMLCSNLKHMLKHEHLLTGNREDESNAMKHPMDMKPAF